MGVYKGENMIYMGCDLSTTSSGIAIFDDEKLIHYECITPKINKKTQYVGQTEDWETRTYLIAQRLDKIFDEYEIEEAYCEDIPLKDGKPTIKKLGVVRGVLLSICATHGTKINPRQVSDWRQDANFFDGTQKGMTRLEMKKKAIEEVKRIFDIVVNDDAAEAILIAYRSKYPKPKKTISRK